MVCTEWPELLEARLALDHALSLRHAIVIDVNGFLLSKVQGIAWCQVSVRGQTSNNMKLKNLVTVVTGASQGLGNAIARAFVGEGAHVALCARDQKLIE